MDKIIEQVTQKMIGRRRSQKIWLFLNLQQQKKAIINGKSLMVQGVGETLDPIFDSLLVKNNISN